MISRDFLAILCCPETKQELVVAEASLIEKLNQKISKQDLRNRAGKVIEQKLEAGLVRADKKFLYPIRSDIPVMLLDEAIPVDGLC